MQKPRKKPNSLPLSLSSPCVCLGGELTHSPPCSQGLTEAPVCLWLVKMAVPLRAKIPQGPHRHRANVPHSEPASTTHNASILISSCLSHICFLIGSKLGRGRRAAFVGLLKHHQSVRLSFPFIVLLGIY